LSGAGALPPPVLASTAESYAEQTEVVLFSQRGVFMLAIGSR